MSKLLLEKWAKQAVNLERRQDFSPVASMAVLDDVNSLAAFHKTQWRRRTREIVETGVPIAMPEGTYAGLLAYPAAQTITTTSMNATANLWSNLTYTPIVANSILAPQAYRVAICAKITTVATPVNISLDPRINNTGVWTTGGTAVAGGSALGASTSIALTASITNAFYYVIGDLMIRTAGTSSSFVGMFHYHSTQGTSGGLAGPAAIGAGHNLLFGGTAVTVDTQTSGQSFQMGAIHTVATITHNIEQIHFMDWN